MGRQVVGADEALEQRGVLPEVLRDGAVVPAHRRRQPLGLVAELGGRADREGAERVDRRQEHHLAAGLLHRGHLCRDVGVGRRVGLLGREAVVAEHAAQARAEVLAEVVVLAEQARGRAGVLLLGVRRERLGLGGVVRVEPEGPRVLLGLVEDRAARRDEQVGHLVLVEEVQHRAVRRRAEAVEHREHAVLEDQLAHHGLRGRGVVAVVLDDVLDAAAVHPAVVVEVREVGAGGGGDGRVAGRRRPGQRVVRAHHHRGVGDAGRGLPLSRALVRAVFGVPAARGEQRGEERGDAERGDHLDDPGTCHR